MALAIEPRLPRYDGAGEYCPLFDDLAGSKLLRIGTAPDCDVEGGGLALEVERRSGEREIVLFAFNDVGLWLATFDATEDEAREAMIEEQEKLDARDPS